MVQVTAEDKVDFEAAALFLDQARSALEAGDVRRFDAARHMIAVALCLSVGAPRPVGGAKK